MQVREYGSPGLGGMYGDEHDDGYSQTGGSYCAAVYQQRPELTRMNYFNLDISLFKAFEGGRTTFSDPQINHKVRYTF